MLSSLKRVREEEQEEGRSVRQRRLATSMGELEEMVLANRRITDSLVGDMEASLEVLRALERASRRMRGSSRWLGGDMVLTGWRGATLSLFL